MYQKSRHIIRLVTLQAALCLLFSISSFADGYSFKVDGDQMNQRFSGTNKVYTDGIYVGDMGIIDVYMDNYGNTYNGTNIIDATAYPGVGQDDNSTYNGKLSVTANDIISSKTTVNDATVNAATNVTVNEVLTDNNLNAGVQFNNSNFNNDVSFSGSGSVNLEGSTINNAILGSVPQMETLINNTANTNTILNNIKNQFDIILCFFDILRHNFTTAQYSPTQDVYRVTYGTQSRSYTYFQVINNIYTYSNGNLSYIEVTRYCNMLGFFVFKFTSFERNLANALTSLWSDIYYPLKNSSLPQYWIAYNTDTGQYDSVNLATVFGYITWYLGQLYNDSTNITNNMKNMTDDINTAATTFQDMEQKEHAAIDQISQGIETFLPDVNQFSSFKAITWCSNYLQQIYLALGSYGTVIFIALLFGVCLQFIGYFRYK